MLPAIQVPVLNVAWTTQRPLVQIVNHIQEPATYFSMTRSKLLCSMLSCHPQHAAAAAAAATSVGDTCSWSTSLLRRAVNNNSTTSGALTTSSSSSSSLTTSLVAVSSRYIAPAITSQGLRHFRQNCTACSATSATGSPQPAGSDYAIAIPSYDRADTLLHRTLASLIESGIDCQRRVHVFVADADERARYARALPRNAYTKIVVGKLGVGKQRSHIMSYFGPGADIVMLDDDIRKFMQVYDGPVDLHKAIVTGFELCRQHDCFMWGINNSSNKFFMRQTYSTNWMFIQGPFMGFRVREEVQLNPTHDDILEDVQYSLMHCHKDGKLLRINGIGLKASPYGKEPGGMQSVLVAAAKAARVQANREYLMHEYGQYIQKWEEDMPHPKMRRSKQHMVRPLEL